MNKFRILSQHSIVSGIFTRPLLKENLPFWIYFELSFLVSDVIDRMPNLYVMCRLFYKFFILECCGWMGLPSNSWGCQKWIICLCSIFFSCWFIYLSYSCSFVFDSRTIVHLTVCRFFAFSTY